MNAYSEPPKHCKCDPETWAYVTPPLVCGNFDGEMDGTPDATCRRCGHDAKCHREYAELQKENAK